jgi:hypothetical protein
MAACRQVAACKGCPAIAERDQRRRCAPIRRLNAAAQRASRALVEAYLVRMDEAVAGSGAQGMQRFLLRQFAKIIVRQHRVTIGIVLVGTGSG